MCHHLWWISQPKSVTDSTFYLEINFLKWWISLPSFCEALWLWLGTCGPSCSSGLASPVSQVPQSPSSKATWGGGWGQLLGRSGQLGRLGREHHTDGLSGLRNPDRE